jgi:2-polyprenyl-3-methyl-5-hydroxy-6-metoxy-1,4-benzoquinol methylase
LGRFLRGRQSVLDYGCGTGYIIPHLLQRGHQVWGLDFSADSIDSVNAQFRGRDGFEGAYLADDLARQGRKFDAIVSIEVIEHLDDHHLAKTLSSFGTLLAPGGVVILTTPNDENLSGSEAFCPVCEHVFHRWQHVRSWSAQSLPAHLTSHGFAVTETLTTDFSVSFRSNPARLLKELAARFLRPGRRPPHLVCVCKPTA